ncbi:MAG TPA: hypothetical protein VFJ58_17215 [Armatimonadota bacterium]|nr:hypothetical protein [Armatimonadota bacterium]
MKAVKVGMVVGLMAVGSAAIGFPTFLTLFKTTYKPDATTALGKANCMTCHMAAGFKLNPYGLDLQKELVKANTKTLTPDMLKAVEKLDSDKDGVSNIDEIKAGTLPGDPKSFPPKADAPTK